MKSLDEAIRDADRHPSMHPHSKHRTVAGPARHVLVESKGDFIEGLVYVGMRKYGAVRIQVHKDWPAAYKRDRYSREIMNAITTAWRC